MGIIVQWRPQLALGIAIVDWIVDSMDSALVSFFGGNQRRHYHI